MEKSPDIFEQIRLFVADHPIVNGIVYLVIGISFLLFAIYDADFIFRKTGSFNLEKIDGLVDMFGRKTIRIAVGLGAVILIFLSIVIIVYYLK